MLNLKRTTGGTTGTAMRKAKEKAGRKQWLPMRIEEVGKLTETILQGGGKLSPTGGDPGENRKQKPTG
jgi:hypothetical protein